MGLRAAGNLIDERDVIRYMKSLFNREGSQAMNKSTLAGFCCAVSICVCAETYRAPSANITAVMRVDLTVDDLTLFSTSLINPGNTINDLFRDLPDGSRIYMWDVQEQSYRIFLKTDLGWGSGGTNAVKNGQGLFIRLPPGAQASVSVSGDVPLEDSLPGFFAEGYALLSYPYPHDVLFIDTGLAAKARFGDEVSFWQNGWLTYTKTEAGWIGAEELRLRPGQAFFYRSSQNTVYAEPRPFEIR